jgi:hypothetical protein
MSEAGHNHERRRRDRLVEGFGDTYWCAFVAGAVHEQGRYLDGVEHVTQVCLGEGVRHHATSHRADLGHDRRQFVDPVRRHHVGEQARHGGRLEALRC